MRLHEARTGSLHRVLIAGAGEGVGPVMLTMRWKATPTAWSMTARDPRVTVVQAVGGQTPIPDQTGFRVTGWDAVVRT
jgi:hypothetical protein